MGGSFSAPGDIRQQCLLEGAPSSENTGRWATHNEDNTSVDPSEAPGQNLLTPYPMDIIMRVMCSDFETLHLFRANCRFSRELFLEFPNHCIKETLMSTLYDPNMLEYFPLSFNGISFLTRQPEQPDPEGEIHTLILYAKELVGLDRLINQLANRFTEVYGEGAYHFPQGTPDRINLISQYNTLARRFFVNVAQRNIYLKRTKDNYPQ